MLHEDGTGLSALARLVGLAVWWIIPEAIAAMTAAIATAAIAATWSKSPCGCERKCDREKAAA